VGDDICWMRPGADGRLYAINPEAGYFGVAPGTSEKTNPNALAMLDRDAIFTNVAVTAEGQRGGTACPASPRSTGRDAGGQGHGPAAHPNSRFTVSARQLPELHAACRGRAGRADLGDRVRRPARIAVPLVFEARDWRTACWSARHGVGNHRRRDRRGRRRAPRLDGDEAFAGYNFADYFAHWLSFDGRGAKLPKVFHVNWFRKGADGKFCGRASATTCACSSGCCAASKGRAGALETPIGQLPLPGRHSMSKAWTWRPARWTR
jgi:phosphoenolpyruvate carboxykinase (GTP)